MGITSPQDPSDKNWLITGGCGFIGVNLIRHLLENSPNANIRVLDNLSVGAREDLEDVCDYKTVDYQMIEGVPSGVELIVSDIRNFEASLSACRGVDVVVHLAANSGVAPSVENPREDMEINVTGTFNMLEASRRNNKVGKFIFASSGAPLGEVEPPIHEEKAPKPVSPYGASKLAGEAYCSSYYRTFGLKTIALRFGNVYGPRSKHKNSVIAKFFKNALAGEALEIYGDGNQTRDFIYIHDLIKAIMLAEAADIGGEVFQIASSRETTVNEIADKIKEITEHQTGRKIQVVYGEPRRGDVKRNYSDITKSKRILGYVPAYDLDVGMRETFDYFAGGKPKRL